jgi:hypothetical protein
MISKKKAAAVEVVPVAETVKVETFVITREQARVVHRALFDTGWWLRWGQTEVNTLTRALNEYFEGDDDHLKRR